MKYFRFVPRIEEQEEDCVEGAQDSVNDLI